MCCINGITGYEKLTSHKMGYLDELYQQQMQLVANNATLKANDWLTWSNKLLPQYIVLHQHVNGL